MNVLGRRSWRSRNYQHLSNYPLTYAFITAIDHTGRCVAVIFHRRKIIFSYFPRSTELAVSWRGGYTRTHTHTLKLTQKPTQTHSPQNQLRWIFLLRRNLQMHGHKLNVQNVAIIQRFTNLYYIFIRSLLICLLWRICRVFFCFTPVLSIERDSIRLLSKSAELQWRIIQ